MLLSTIFYLCSLPSMQAVTPDNVCNIIILLTVYQFHFLYFHIFLTAFSLYIPCIYL
jgi:hypothetical protein